MQYTIRNVPADLDTALRERARVEGKSLNQVVLEVLAHELQADGARRRRDLSAVAGSWVEDPDVDDALAEQRRVDPGLWR